MHISPYLSQLPIADSLGWLGTVFTLAAIGLIVLMVITIVNCWKRVEQGQALIINKPSGTRVSFRGAIVIPVIHKHEYMDISLKRIEVDRTGTNGLICKDNMRADIKVAFFVRVNNVADDCLRVAQSIGCDRASSPREIEGLFDAKFSEALKTVGKRFDFTELYEERDTFRDEILKVIGTDLNGFVLDDCAIDHLEQTPLESLDPNNILDSEGIKKITDITAREAALANQIEREKQKTIKQQDVEAQEAILELERQLAETEARQSREVKVVAVREKAEADKVAEEERYKSEQARIKTEEELAIAEENKQRQILIALRNKERSDVVEIERVKREQEMESIERERLTALKDIEREKAVEIERKAIQEVIKERVAVEKNVVIEQEKIKDTEAFAAAERAKEVAVTNAAEQAEADLILRTKEAEASKTAAELKAEEEYFQTLRNAEASKKAAELRAEEVIVEAEAREAAAEKDAKAKIVLADGVTREAAAEGLGEADVIRAQAVAEAEGIKDKAAAMKLFNEAGQDHEEFKLTLDKEKQVELAEIDVHRQVAAEQARVVSEALKSANIDIVGGETEFFDRITNAVTRGKALERTVSNSDTLEQVREALLADGGSGTQNLLERLGLESEDLKNLSAAALMAKLSGGGDLLKKLEGSES